MAWDDVRHGGIGVSPSARPDAATPLWRLSILLVEPDRFEADELVGGLQHDGHSVAVEPTYQAAFHRAMWRSFDVVVLEVELPDGDGIDLIAALRSNGVNAPIIALSRCDTGAVTVRALDTGADDYLVLPVSQEVFGAHVRAVHRRWQHPPEAPVRVDDLVLEPTLLTAHRGEVVVELTPSQVDVLRVLMENVGHVLSRVQIERCLPDHGTDRRSNVVAVHISALRAKLDEPFDLKSIETVRGMGYRLRRRPH